MHNLSRRYKVEALLSCSKCSGVIITGKLLPGTAEDPTEREPEVNPPPTIPLRPSNPFEASMLDMKRSFEQIFPGAQFTWGAYPGGPRDVHKREEASWGIELTKNEYDQIGPLNLGDVLVLQLHKESNK